MKLKRFIWGIFYLLAAGIIIYSQVVGFATLGFWSVTGLALCAAVALHCLINLEPAGLAVPAAVAYMILNKPMGWPYINPWLLLAAAGAAWIGLHILLPHKGCKKRWSRSGLKYHWNGNIEIDGVHGQTDDDSNVTVETVFGGTSRYLHSSCLEKVTVSSVFGSVELHLKDSIPSPAGVRVHIDNVFAGTQIYIPREWSVTSRIDSVFGGVDVQGQFANQGEGVPNIELSGDTVFGGITVIGI